VNLIGYAASALFISWVVSRVARWFLFKREVGWRRVLLPNVVALALLTLLEAVNAVGGSSRILGALLLYGSSALLLTLMDLLIAYMRGRLTSQGSPT
jgi:hypothetical protein